MRWVSFEIFTWLATPNDHFAMQVLLVHEEGGRIEGTIKKEHMRKFVNLLVAGQVYKITDFAINSNFGKFRASRHDYKLSFNGGTKITPFPNVSMPFHGLSLSKSSDIVETRDHSNYLIGRFHGGPYATSDEMRLVSRDGRDTRLLLLDLVDEMGKIRCAIFGDFIDTVAEFLNLPRCGLPVVTVQLAKVNIYKGEVGIQNVMNASKILWDPDIPEAIEFKNGLAVHEVETSVDMGIIAQRRPIVPIRDDFLKLNRNKTIKDLVEFEEDGSFILLAYVSEICDESNWWYMACMCLKSVKHDGVTYYCRHCNTHMFHATPRYKLKLQVSDGEDHARLVLFDAECYTLFNRACKDMLLESKNKFAPLFPTIGYVESSISLLDDKSEPNSVITIADNIPNSGGEPAATIDEGPSSSKRGGDQSVEALFERTKRGWLLPIKMEKMD
ncbi:hypothetical protein SESBI_20748 [Sesbania bispinosa]|nr:hypothetical protein SESBI_20748 [Sesbania bispinosa]